MSQYGLIYRLQWNTVPSVVSATVTVPAQAMVVNIYDTETIIEDSETPQVIILQAAANPLVIKIINNDEDKFSPVRAKQAVIEFISKQNEFQDSLTFADSTDNRWYVEITADGQFVFKGFLMLTDSQQDHLPDPNTVVLTASDHLALLKDITLTTDALLNPEGKYRIGELIALCLKKTGLRLDIIAINNLRHGSGELTTLASFTSSPNQIIVAVTDFFFIGQRIDITGTAGNNIRFTVTDIGQTIVTIVASDDVFTDEASVMATFTDVSSQQHIYDGIYLGSKTFEQEIGVSEDCYTVLEKILGEDCFLTQWLGKWYIMRVDEYDGNPIYPATFDPDGVFVSFDPPTSFSKSIGAAETRRLANADALRKYDRPQEYIKEVADLEYPFEIPCNSDFARGDFIADLPDETNNDGLVMQVKSYELECWNFLSKQGGTANQIGFYDQQPIANSDAYVKKFFYNDDERNRELIIETPAASGTGTPYVKSEAIPLTIDDKIIFTVDLKYSNIGASTGYVNTPVMIGLFANSGNIYWWVAYDILNTALRQNWQLTPATGSGSTIPDFYSGASIDDPPLNINFESPPLPESGNVYIYLINQYASQIKAHYSNLSISVLSFINGSYGLYRGFYNKVTRDPVGYFNSRRERPVYVFDSPKPLLKGAMFFISGTRLLFSGSVTFATNSINVSGYSLSQYTIGQRLLVTGTNAGNYTVTGKEYHIIGDTTEIFVREALTVITESATISEYLFSLTVRWYTAAPFALGPPPDTTYLHPYGYIQAFSVWNQYRNANRILTSTVLGLGSMWVDALDKISLTDNNPHVNDRYFMLISYEQNWKTALWSGVFVEDYRTDIGKVYDDDHEFRYITK